MRDAHLSVLKVIDVTFHSMQNDHVCFNIYQKRIALENDRSIDLEASLDLNTWMNNFEKGVENRRISCVLIEFFYQCFGSKNLMNLIKCISL